MVPRARLALTGGALLLPTLALAGFVAGGNETAIRTAADPGAVGRATADAPSDANHERLGRQADLIRAAVLLAAAAVRAARLARHVVRRRRGLVRVGYPDGRSVAGPRGFSVLEASSLLGVPHASVCGARGRCSTCRVRVAAAAPTALPAPGDDEARVLRRVGAAPDVRLACQLRPRGPVSVAPLLDAALPPRELLRFRAPRMLGAEREAVIAFADLRDFTRITEHRLPFDVVHLLNRHFRAIGAAAGGRRPGGQVRRRRRDGAVRHRGRRGRPGRLPRRLPRRAGRRTGYGRCGWMR